MYQGRQTMGVIIDKTKGKINQAVGDLTGKAPDQIDREIPDWPALSP
jgi:uncharacterized protein YjbJ (UPF0337 family)